MILNSVKSAVTTSETLDHKQASISLNPVILHILSRDLYQNHIESPFREILINAVDAHIEAGVTTPVDIHLPTMWDETFYIRDHGLGLSHERFMEIYLDYGNSDRRSSNDVHGGLGLGTKSPLAYTTSFTVTSWHDKHERTYIVYYNEDNIPCVDLVNDVECSGQESGLKVQFTTVATNDWTQFHTAATEILCRLPPGSFDIVNNAAIGFAENAFILPESHPVGPIRLYKGKGKLSVVMGYVNYRLDSKTVLDYLNTRNIKLNVSGKDVQVSSLITKLISSNNVEIVANIGDYPVHPSREYINVTPRAITKLCQELESFLQVLFSKTDLSLEEDTQRYNLAGILETDKAVRPIRARYIHPERYYSYNRRIPIPVQLRTYFDLVRSHSEWGGHVQVAMLDGAQLTDYVGNGRRQFVMPTGFPTDTALLLIDKGLMTDPEVIADLGKYVPVDVSADIEAYLKERDREASLNHDLNIPSHARVHRTRNIVRSMQDKSHNILMLKPEAFSQYAPGGRKIDWASGAYNVSSLQDMEKEIFWLPTKIGCARGDSVDTLKRYAGIRAIVPTWKAPIFIGLPASKGTLSFEKAFKPISELGAWIDTFLASDYVKRRLRIAVLNDSIDYSVASLFLDAIQSYGGANWLSRLINLNRYSRPMSGVIQLGGANFTSEIATIKSSADFDKLTSVLQDLAVKFPLCFNRWGYGHSDIITSNDSVESLTLWATQVAQYTNTQPTGMRNKP